MASTEDLTQISLVIYISATDQFLCKNEVETVYQIDNKKSVRATLKDVTYTKKIYEPCLLTCTIQLESIDKTDTPVSEVIKLARKFKAKKVDAFRGGMSTCIAQNYFVYRAIPTHEKDDAISVKLEIYSMDKLLDTMSYSRSYVARKLRKEILGDAIARCKFGDLAVPVANNDELQYMSYEDHKKEFVQPYIVQFNETPYSMLRRTANRSGEFLFFEDGGIHLGLPKVKEVPEVGNDGESKMQFKSVSYSEAITSEFGKDLQYQSDNYQKADENTYYSALLDCAEAPFTASLEMLKKSLNNKADQEKFQSLCDPFENNRKLRDLYERAKSAVISSQQLKLSLEKNINEKAELCEGMTDTPSQKAILSNALRFMEAKKNNVQSDLSKEEEELRKLEALEKESQALEAELAALEAEKEKCPITDPNYQKKYTLCNEKLAELNLHIQKNGNLEAIKAKKDACLEKIIALKKENDKLKNNIDKFKSSSSSDADKQAALAATGCEQEVKDFVEKEIEKRNNNIAEITKAIEDHKKEPEILSKNKAENPWSQFVEWTAFSGKDGQTKLEGIWSSVFNNGSKRYPIDIESSIENLKQFAKDFKENKQELTPEAQKQKEVLGKACDNVIAYCEAILKTSEPKEVKTENSVYHMEYGNDEYLETYKKDQSVGFWDVYFFAYSNQEEHPGIGATKMFFDMLGQFLSDGGDWKSSLAGTIVATAGFPAAVAEPFAIWDQYTYNELYLRGYQHNGDKVQNSEYGGSDEISLFGTYGKKTKISEKEIEALSALFYQKIWEAEKAVSDQKIIIHIDTATNKVFPKLGHKIKYDGVTYIITSITGQRASMSNALISEEIIEAIPMTGIKNGEQTILLAFPPESGYPRYVKAEPQLATVVDDDDPSFYARVRVRYKWQPGGKSKDSGDEPTPWIRVGTPFASSGGGMLFIPKPGNDVMIDYENGNIERPFVSNAVYSRDNLAPMPKSTKKPTRMMISTPNGHSIKFKDSGAACALLGAVSSFDPIIGGLGKGISDYSPVTSPVNPSGGITISDSYGFYSISCSAEKRAISIKSPLGSIGLSAFTGINISAPNGDIKITGKNVTIAANNELRLASGLNVKKKIDDESSAVTTGAGVMNGIIGGITGLIPQIIDLKLFRYVYERFVPPISGSMALKSYRFILVDAGKEDFNVKQIKANNNTMTYYNQRFGKGWRDADTTKEDGKGEIGISKKNVKNMWTDNFGAAFADVRRSFTTEQNNWRVDSEKNAIFIAGDRYTTNEGKTKLLLKQGMVQDPVPGALLPPTDKAGDLYSDIEDKPKWNVAVNHVDRVKEPDPKDYKAGDILGNIGYHATCIPVYVWEFAKFSYNKIAGLFKKEKNNAGNTQNEEIILNENDNQKNNNLKEEDNMFNNDENEENDDIIKDLSEAGLNTNTINIPLIEREDE